MFKMELSAVFCDFSPCCYASADEGGGIKRLLEPVSKMLFLNVCTIPEYVSNLKS